jgi:transcriptional regulator with XRE-family HTH domain
MTIDFQTYSSFMKEFGTRLRALREKAVLTQRELARLAGIEAMQISRYERGVGYPAVETLLALAKTLDVDLDYLLLGKTEQAATGDTSKAFRHVLLLEKLREADQELGRKDVEMVVALVDAFLVRKRMKKIVNE